MTPEEFHERMKAFDGGRFGDAEEDHRQADDLMCELLRSLGYGDGVSVFENMTKWYA